MVADLGAQPLPSEPAAALDELGRRLVSGRAALPGAPQVVVLRVALDDAGRPFAVRSAPMLAAEAGGPAAPPAGSALPGALRRPPG
jgi:hypothetical protein